MSQMNKLWAFSYWNSPKSTILGIFENRVPTNSYSEVGQISQSRTNRNSLLSIESIAEFCEHCWAA